MEAVEAEYSAAGGEQSATTLARPDSEIQSVSLLVPDNPYAPESEYGRRDCLTENERLRGKFDELFPRDCRPQTGGSGLSSGPGRSPVPSTPDDGSGGVIDDGSGGGDGGHEPPPPPKPPSDADCSCSVPDFLAGYHFQTIGSAASELLRGNSLDGGAGNDTLQGGNGNDVFSGGAGNDQLEPGAGDDRVSGGSGDDTVNGGPGQDIVRGGSGNDIVNGGPDNDTLTGDAGHDTLSGGAGNDCVLGGAGKDTINGGTGDDHLCGDEGNDFIVGHDGNDELFGGRGNDFLRGDAGNDTLTGGFGHDVFYGGAVTGHDVVMDFTHGQDELDLRGMGLTSWALVSAHSVNTTDGVLITLGSNAVLLHGVHQIMAHDFVF